jgi:hypothetical protein
MEVRVKFISLVAGLILVSCGQVDRDKDKKQKSSESVQAKESADRPATESTPVLKRPDHQTESASQSLPKSASVDANHKSQQTASQEVSYYFLHKQYHYEARRIGNDLEIVNLPRSFRTGVEFADLEQDARKIFGPNPDIYGQCIGLGRLKQELWSTVAGMVRVSIPDLARFDGYREGMLSSARRDVGNWIDNIVVDVPKKLEVELAEHAFQRQQSELYSNWKSLAETFDTEAMRQNGQDDFYLSIAQMCDLALGYVSVNVVW